MKNIRLEQVMNWAGKHMCFFNPELQNVANDLEPQIT